MNLIITFYCSVALRKLGSAASLVSLVVVVVVVVVTSHTNY